MTTHYMIAEGTGAITSHRFRPICQPHARPVVIHFEDRGTVDPDARVCTDCLAIKAAADERGITL
jgi:hypothetical protein